MTGKTMTSDALLLLTASIWGFAFVAQRAGMDYIGPFLYTGIRFLLGALVLLPFLLLGKTGKTDAGVSKTKLISMILFGSLAGVFLFLGVSFQQVGLLHTTAGKAGFITGLYVIIVPILGIIRRQRTRFGTWLGAIFAVVGLYLLSVTGGFRFSQGVAWEAARGDLLVLASAFFWAIHVHVIGWLSPKIESVKLAMIQFTFCGVVSLCVAFATEAVELSAVLDAALPIGYGGICSVGIAYTLQVVAQKRAPAAHAAIIMSLEGVFAVLGGYLLLNEVLNTRGIVGCALMLIGMVLSQIAVIRATRGASELYAESTPRSSS